MFVPATVAQCDLLVLAEYPTELDCTHQRPIQPALRPVQTMIIENGEGLRVAYQFAVGCTPPLDKRHKPLYKPSVVKACGERLKHYVQSVQPKVILALGRGTLAALGVAPGQKISRGSINQVKIGQVTATLVLSVSPRALSGTYDSYFVLERDVQKAIDLCHAPHEQLEIGAPQIETLVEYEEIIVALNHIKQYVDEQYEATGRKRTILAFDTETTSLKAYRQDSRVIAVSLAYRKNHAIAFCLDHREVHFTADQRAQILQALETLFDPEKVMLCAANAKFDYNFLTHRVGISMAFPELDILTLEHCLYSDKRGEYNLKNLTRDYLPQMGGFEAELNQALAQIKADHSKVHEQQTAEALSEHMDTWLGLDGLQRRHLLSQWVRQGSLPATLVDELAEPKIIKRGGTVQVSKAYKTRLSSILRRLPAQALGIELPEEKEPTFEDIPVLTLLKYAALDAWTTRTIFFKQFQKAVHDDLFRKNQGLDRDTRPIFEAFQKHTMPLALPIADMEYHGVRIDREKAKQYAANMKEKILELEGRIFSRANRSLNLSANSKDLNKFLFEELKYTPINFGNAGSPTMDEKQLKALYDKHKDPILTDLLAHRKIKKALTTYVQKWVTKSDYDSKLHFSLNQAGTRTYRLSSNNPSLQNVPLKIEEAGVNLKELLLPDTEDYELYDLDIANAEMRVLCAYSQDKTLIRAFNEGKDIHCLTAASISNYTYEEIMAHKEDKGSEQYKLRQKSKSVNFGIVYMMGAKSLARDLWDKHQLEVTEQEAQQYLNGFFETYPGVASYIETTKEMLHAHKVAFTKIGRQRHFPQLHHPTKSFQKGQAEREAVNFSIQSTSADILNSNLVDLYWRIKPLDGRIILTVHDSVLFQLPKGTEGVQQLLDTVFLENTKERFAWLPVAWKYDVGKGPNYGHCNEKI